MIRVVLPYHLRTLAGVGREITVEVVGPVTIRSVLDAVEVAHPKLLGTVRDHQTQKRRPLVRFFACGEDVSHDPPDMPLPPRVVDGREPFILLGAIAGG